MARIPGRRRFIIRVPLWSPSLSARWLWPVTDVDAATGRSLIDSMSNEVVVRDDSIRTLIRFEPTPYYQAVPTAPGERALASPGAA